MRCYGGWQQVREAEVNGAGGLDREMLGVWLYGYVDVEVRFERSADIANSDMFNINYYRHQWCKK